jgi:LytS/YehU family sensor histidine kinase
MLSIEFFEFWKKSLTEREALKRDNITAEFESLKNQVNPHFLFNSLNTLSSIIEEDPKTATQFVQKLSSVYRYVLAQRDKETVTLHEELNFIESYVYLNKIRFGENLKVEILVDESLRQSQIATLTLQLLMENAIKHNVVSKDKPLSIEIGIKNSRIYVKNNLQAKKIHAESNGIGLSNIISRYKYLSKEEVIVSSSNNYFEVSVPLID